MCEGMAGSNMAEGIGKMDYVWGAKVGSNYKSVTIDDEVYALGDCVRCVSKPCHIGKIVKLFEKEGKGICRIRNFYSSSQFPVSVKGLDDSTELKELFLASGEGLGVEIDILLEAIVGKCIILCTAEESFNEVPSREQVEAADYFFRRGYDPAAAEVVGLDSVEEAIGAQKVYNKKDWLLLVDKTFARSSSQVSASRLQRQSPDSSSHQGAAIAVRSSVPEVSPAPSGDSTERKLKKKSDDLEPEPTKVDAVENENEELHIPKTVKGDLGAMPTEKPSSERLVFCIPAPSKSTSRRRRQVVSLVIHKDKPPTSSKAKAVKPEGKGVKPVWNSSIAPLGFKKKDGIKDGAVDSGKKKKHENMPSIEDGAVTSDKKLKLKTKPSAEVGGETSEKKRKSSTEDGAVTGEKKKKLETKPSTEVGAESGDKKRKPSTEDGAVTGEKKKKPETKPSTKVGGEKKKKLETKPSTEVGAESGEKKKKHVIKPSNEDGAVSSEKKGKHETKPGTEAGAVSGEKKLNRENMPTIKRVPKIIVKPMERTNALAEKAKPSKLEERADEGVAIASSPGAELKSKGQIFKPRVQDWEVSNFIPAVNNNRVLLLQNLVTGLHSDDLAEALTEALKCRCDVRIVPPVSPHYGTTSALLKLPSPTCAREVLQLLTIKAFSVGTRLLTASLFKPSDFKAPTSKFPGHIEFPKEGRNYTNEDYRDAVATSHFAQGNTIEFDYGLPWRALDEQHEEQWRLLQEACDTKP